MEKYLDILSRAELFRGIGAQDLMTTLQCLNARLQTYKKDEYVWLAEEEPTFVGVVLEGQVLITQEDLQGNRNIITNVGAGDSFAEAMACSNVKKLPTSVMATVDSVIMLVEYRKIIHICPSACSFHNKMIENMLIILANKNVQLTKKLDYVSKRKTSEKILAYLHDEATKARSMEFNIKFDRQELADYLCVERSALSKELSRLAQEGVLEYKKNMFRLLG